MKEAYLYDSLDGQKTKCRLCYKQCVIAPGDSGFCKVRTNIDGKLYADNYGISTHFVRDTIETEGVFHYRPGCATIEMGTYGCNLHCKFCQNWKYSQADKTDIETFVEYTPESVVAKCKEMNIDLICWTFNDPIIWYEFVLDTSKIAKESGITSLYKSSHIINKEALENLCENIDVFSVSLKAMDNDFYKEHCEGSIKPVKEALQYLHGRGDKHLEVSNLVIPEKNDSDKDVKKLVSWVLENLDATVPLHFVEYHPDYQFTIPRTPIATVMRARDIAKEMGMKHVYIGNEFASEGLNTICSNCNSTLIEREGHYVNFTEHLDKDDPTCKKCGTKIERMIF